MSCMATVPAIPLTEEEYLRIERDAVEKSEFYAGEMLAMAGSTPNHAHLSASIIALLHGKLPAGCRVYSSDLRIKVEGAGLFTYPDCSVICGAPVYAGDRRDIVLNPLLIAEVLSPSSESYDRGKKFELYRTIPTFLEYLIIHQDRRHVEYHSKQDDGSWLLREYIGDDGTITIARLDVRIGIAELYASALDLN